MALSGIGKAAIPVLVSALTDTNKIVRRTAAFSLSRIDKLPKETLLALTVTLNDSDVSVRVSAAAALAKVDPSSRKKTVLILTEALNSKDEFARGFANYSLKKIRELDALFIEEKVKTLILSYVIVMQPYVIKQLWLWGRWGKLRREPFRI